MAPDRREQRFLIAEPPEVIRSLERHEGGMRQMPGEVLARAEAHGAVAAPMQHQRFRRDPRQQGADVGLSQRAQHLTDRARRRGLAQQPRPPGAQCRLMRGAGPGSHILRHLPGQGPVTREVCSPTSRRAVIAPVDQETRSAADTMETDGCAVPELPYCRSAAARRRQGGEQRGCI